MSLYVAVEFNEDSSDCRPFGKSGEFLTGQFSEADIQTFVSIDSALNTASKAPNARPGCSVEAIGQHRKVKS